MLDINKIYNMDNVEGLLLLDDDSIDLTITSPPYSDIRDYKGYTWDFEKLSQELFRVTKKGGVVVWVVGDRCKNGELLTPFRQCLYFADVVGFNVWDTMIYKKPSNPFPENVRYTQVFEFMFVLSKGKVKTFNRLMEDKSEGELKKILSNNKSKLLKTWRRKDGSMENVFDDINALSRIKESWQKTRKSMTNVWDINAGYMHSSKDAIAFEHPAIFPEQLAQNHILTWSNPGDIVLDPFMGSGTVAKSAILNERKYIGFEISEEYCSIAEKRLSLYNTQKRLQMD